MTDAAARGGAMDVAAARDRIAPYVVRTRVVRDEVLGVWLKAEHEQHTGSFKLRGAANRMVALDASERERGVVTCSSGNHGRAVAYMGRALGVPTTIFVPSWVDPVKTEFMTSHGARVLRAGETFDETESRSFDEAAASGATYVSAYDDPWVIAGQGTIGLELAEQIPDVAAVLVPISGGGLVTGIGLALEGTRPAVTIVAVSAERARVMYESVRAGHPIALPEEETLATALSGGIGGEGNRYTFGLVRRLVDRHLVVSERAIAAAMRQAYERHGFRLEGGGATALAALHGDDARIGPGTAVILSGGNIDAARWRRVMDGGEAGSS